MYVGAYCIEGIEEREREIGEEIDGDTYIHGGYS